MFTGTADGRVVKLENGEVETIARFGSGPCKTRDDEPACGRPLGIRAGPNGTLFVADAYKGLFEVNPWKREVKLLLSSETPIEGRKMSFVNDLTVTRDGRKIYFTDSSSKWQRRDYLLLVMEGTDDGRLLEYDTETKEVKVLLDHLRFPNGVQLSPAEDFVLVAELTMARIRRFYVSGLMKGGADLFVENLPGFPDNIRASSSGGYWVGMSTIRSNPGFSMLDFLSERPYLKRMIFKPGAATRPYLQDPRSALLQNVPALGCLVFLTVRFRLCLSGALSVTCREVPGVPLSLQCPSPHPVVAAGFPL
ncbi:Adipocyte plasma membrane-associated protein, partial [Eschrichtius robustus]|nr:Adipocyte plasma membrane-associated protein [Eschrichtius robustus]